jgi:hypothetical protein
MYSNNTMPFKSTSSSADIKTTQSDEQQKEFHKKMKFAESVAQDELAGIIFQYIAETRKTGPDLEAILELMWQEAVEDSERVIKNGSLKRPQLSKRIDLSKADYDLLQGNIKPEDIPVKNGSPIELTPKKVISHKGGRPFREYVNQVWLPNGLNITIFPCKDKNGDKNWSYWCNIIRQDGFDTSDWDQ